MKTKYIMLIVIIGMTILLAGCSPSNAEIKNESIENNFQGAWMPSDDIKMKVLVFALPEMDKKMCETFPRLIISTLESTPGVIDAVFEYDGHVVTVYYDSLSVKRDALLNNEAYVWIGTQFISEDKSQNDPVVLFRNREENNPVSMPGEHMAEVPLPEKEYNDLSAIEFKELIEDEDVFVLDVHTPEQKHIPGTDAVIPFDELSENIAKLPKDKNTKIAIYCRSGSMSKIASEELAKAGYTNINNLIGGINEWKMEGFPVQE